MNNELKPALRSERDIEDRIAALRLAGDQQFQVDDLLEYLPDSRRMEIGGSDGPQLQADRESVLAAMREYMPFAWCKADDGRGLSAMRSLEHYAAWVWLLGDDWRFPDLTNAKGYGHQQLLALCRHYGFDHAGRNGKGRLVKP